VAGCCGAGSGDRGVGGRAMGASRITVIVLFKQMIYKMLNELCILHMRLCSFVQFFISNSQGTVQPKTTCAPRPHFPGVGFNKLAWGAPRAVHPLHLSSIGILVQSSGCCCRRLV